MSCNRRAGPFRAPVMIRFATFLLFSASAVSAAADASAGQKAAASDLARVAIMQFQNESQSANYEWVEKSLPDAINDSMRARFEFIRQDENKVAAVAARYKLVNGEYQQADADKIARESQSDILIFGNFRLNETGDKLVLRAIIYNAQGKKSSAQLKIQALSIQKFSRRSTAWQRASLNASMRSRWLQNEIGRASCRERV